MSTSITVPAPTALADDELAAIDAYWRAANYLSVGQIYLLDNPLLCRPPDVVVKIAPVSRPRQIASRASAVAAAERDHRARAALSDDLERPVPSLGAHVVDLGLQGL